MFVRISLPAGLHGCIVTLNNEMEINKHGLDVNRSAGRVQYEHERRGEVKRYPHPDRPGGSQSEKQRVCEPASMIGTVRTVKKSQSFSMRGRAQYE